MDQLDEQTMQMAEEQITLERKKLPSLNLLPEEERKRIVHRVIILTTPMIIHEDNNLRARGTEIISDFSKTVGIATMIDVMRHDINDMDEYVRNGAAVCFSIVASTLGIPAILPLLRETCWNMKSWQARHTGIMIVHKIAILMRSTALLVGSDAIQPHLVSLMEIIEPRLKDETKKVRTITTLAMDVLTEVAAIRY
uniref:Splicing factor 3B subunit n=1 Tax=Solanum tuberosum TaxID=4113 RepID=M1DKN8_SOLTU